MRQAAGMVISILIIWLVFAVGANVKSIEDGLLDLAEKIEDSNAQTEPNFARTDENFQKTEQNLTKVTEKQLFPLKMIRNFKEVVHSEDGLHLAWTEMSQNGKPVLVPCDVCPGGVKENPYEPNAGSRMMVWIDGVSGPKYYKIAFSPKITNEGIEYLAEKDGMLLKCSVKF